MVNSVITNSKAIDAHLLWCPGVQVHGLDPSYVDTEIAMNARTSDAQEYAQIP